MNIDYPFHFDNRGRTAEPSDDDHIRDLIEQVLFTLPGERVNRPTFGSGLLQLVFAPNSDTLAAATQLSVQASLQQWLGSLVQIEAVNVESDDCDAARDRAVRRAPNPGTPRAAVHAGGADVTTQYLCRTDSATRCGPHGARRRRQAVLNGIDYLEVGPGDSDSVCACISFIRLRVSPAPFRRRQRRR